MTDKKRYYTDEELEGMGRHLSSEVFAKAYENYRRNFADDCKKISFSIPKVGSEYYQKANQFRNGLYTNKDIRRICGISNIQISHWLQSSVIKPFQDSIGRGKVKKFSHRNLVEFMICRELNRFGLSVHMMRDIIENLRTTEYFVNSSDTPITIWHLFETFGPVDRFQIALWIDQEAPGIIKCAVFNDEALTLWVSDRPDESPQGIIMIRLHTLLREIEEKIEEIKK